MIHAGFGGGEKSWQRLVVLLSDRAVALLQGNPWRPGLASGALVVTNLTVATNRIGTAWFPP